MSIGVIAVSGIGDLPIEESGISLIAFFSGVFMIMPCGGGGREGRTIKLLIFKER